MPAHVAQLRIWLPNRHPVTTPALLHVLCSAQSALELFTDIHVGDPAHSFYNGGPEASGPNAGAFTTYWNIRRCVGRLGTCALGGGRRTVQ